MYKPTFRPLATALATTLLCACATPNVAPKLASPDQTTTPSKAISSALKLDETWTSQSIISEGNASVILYTPQLPPPSLLNQKVDIELRSNATLVTVAGILADLGYSVAVNPDTNTNQTFYIPKFSGTLGNFLQTLTKVTNTWFTWDNGVIHISAYEHISVALPSEKNLQSQFGTELASLIQTGGSGSATATPPANPKASPTAAPALSLPAVSGSSKVFRSPSTGIVDMYLAPNEFKRVTAFVQRFTNNAAMVNIQLAILSVILNQSSKQGINWDSLMVAGTAKGSLPEYYSNSKGLTNLVNTGSLNGTTTATTTTGTTGTTGTGTTGTTGTTTAATTLSELSSIGALVSSGSGLQAALFTKAFTFSGLFNYLQNYGDTETQQNIMVQSFNNVKVDLTSLTNTPYVSDLGSTAVTSTSGGSTASNSSSNIKTDKAKDGVSLSLVPTFDSYAGTVGITLDLKLDSVLGMVQLSAGTTGNIAQLSQPTTAERKFSTTLQMRPGQTAVVGGLSYDSITKNTSSPSFLKNDKYDYKTFTVNRQTMFIVMRPTIVKLGRILENTTTPDTADQGMTLPVASEMPTTSFSNKPTNKSK